MLKFLCLCLFFVLVQFWWRLPAAFQIILLLVYLVKCEKQEKNNIWLGFLFSHLFFHYFSVCVVCVCVQIAKTVKMLLVCSHVVAMFVIWYCGKSNGNKNNNKNYHQNVVAHDFKNYHCHSYLAAKYVKLLPNSNNYGKTNSIVVIVVVVIGKMIVH